MTCQKREDAEIEEKYKDEGKKRIEKEERKARRFIYIGESNISGYERGVEHQNVAGGCKTSSHMLRHLLAEHEREEESWDSIEFGMKILKATRSAYETQVLESVTIQKERRHHLMNNKAERNSCALPRLKAKVGEVDLEKWRDEDKEEMIRKASIEEKLRIRKKQKAEDRAEKERRRDTNQPKKKKIRLEQCVEGDPEEKAEAKEVATSPAKKRKVGVGEKAQPVQRRRTGTDIKGYITCKRWGLVEEASRVDHQKPHQQPQRQPKWDGKGQQQHHHHRQ